MCFRRTADQNKSEDQYPALKEHILFAVAGFLFLFCCFTEADLAENGNIIWTLPYTVKTLTFSLAGGISGGIAVCYLMDWFVHHKYTTGIISSKADKRQNLHKKISPLQLFICSLVLIVLAWLPGYLAFYPRICAYDSSIQIEQIESGVYIDHHPLAHTLLIKGAMNLGKMITGNVNTGIGLYTFFQLLFLGAVFAWSIALLKKRGLGIIGLILLQTGCMFYPFHWYMSISMTKDIIFTGFFLLQLLSLSELVVSADCGKKHKILFFSVQ